VEPLVRGFPNASFKKFSDRGAALAFLRAADAPGDHASAPRTTAADGAHCASGAAGSVCVRKQSGGDLPAAAGAAVPHEIAVRTCGHHGPRAASASYALWYGDGDARNETGALPVAPHTEQRAQLFAVQRALEQFASAHDSQRLCVVCGSSYAVRACRDYLPLWVRWRWRTSRDAPVANQDILRPIARLLYGVPPDCSPTSCRGDANARRALCERVRWKWLPSRQRASSVASTQARKRPRPRPSETSVRATAVGPRQAQRHSGGGLWAGPGTA